MRREALMAAIVQNSDDAIISKSLDGTVLSWNRAAEKTFDYSAMEALGKHISFLIPEDRAGEEASIVERLKRVRELEQRRKKAEAELMETLTDLMVQLRLRLLARS